MYTLSTFFLQRDIHYFRYLKPWKHLTFLHLQGINKSHQSEYKEGQHKGPTLLCFLPVEIQLIVRNLYKVN